MQSSMLRHITEDFGNGGTIDGDLTISGDLTVSGGGSLSFDEIIEGTSQIKVTDTSAFLVEKADGTDVFVVDTTNSRANLGARVGTAILEVKGAVNNDYAGRFENTDSGGYGALVKIAGTTADDLAFQVRADSTNILTINGDSSSTFGGNVGIGTSPSDTLHLSASVPIIRLTDSDTNDYHRIYGSNGGLYFDADKGNSVGSSVMAFGVDDSRVMTLVSGGNVGIGTDNPLAKLVVSDGGNAGIELQPEISTDTNRITNYDRTANAYMDFKLDALSHNIQVSGSSAMYIDNNGKVGIGTEVGSAYFSDELVVQVADNGGITIANTDTTHSAYLMFADGTSGDAIYRCQVGYDHNIDRFGIWTASANALMIDSSQRVGIGETSPDTILHIKGTGDLLKLESTNDGVGGAQLDFYHQSATTANNDIVGTINFGGDDSAGNATTYSRISGIATNVSSGSETGAIQFSTRTDGSTFSEKMRLDNNGRLGIGTDSPSELLHLESAEPVLRFTDSDDSKYHHIFASSDDLYISADRGTSGTGGNIIFRVGSTSEKMRIDGSGNVGIGSDSPISNLEIKGTNSSLDGVSAGLVVHDSGSVNAGLQLINNSGKFALHADGANDRVDFYLDDATTGSSFAGGDKILTLKYGGNVGISQDNPQSKLHINVGTDQNLEVTSVSSKLHLMGTNDARSANIPLTLGFTEYDFEGATGSTIRLKSTNSNITGEELVGKVEAYISDASGNLPGVAGSIDWTTNGSIDGGASKGTNFTLKTYLESAGLVTNMVLDGNSRISLSNNDSGTDNTVFGYEALDSFTATGHSNTVIGHQTAKNASANAWQDNVAIGYRALYTSGAQNLTDCVIIGSEAGYSINSTLPDGTVAIGSSSLYSLSSGTGNTAIGYQSMDALTVGISNVALGWGSLTTEVEGQYNTAIGYQALREQNAGGSDGTATTTANTALGWRAGYQLTTGTNNTFLGRSAGDVVTTGGSNVIIGSLADPSANSGNNQIVIGYNATGSGDNVAVIGNSSITDVLMAQDGEATVHCSGVKFPPTQIADANANTLDDYEEGTWTAVSASGLSLTLEQNKYVKVGKLVTATMIVTFPSTSNSDLVSLSLPITADTISSSSGGAIIEQNINSSQSYTAAVDGANILRVRLRGATSQTNGQLSGKKIRFVITYHSA